jgi:hypothetical protein
MSQLKSELRLSDKVIQLLEATGYADTEVLAAADATALRDALITANSELKLYKKPPSLKQVTEWIKTARNLDDADSEEFYEQAAPDAAEMINFENDPDVVEMIAMAPLALPLPGKLLAAKQVPVQEIPEAILLTAARGDISIRVGTKSPEKKQEKTVIKTPVVQGSYVNTISFGQKKKEVNRTRIRSTDEFTDPNVQVQQREEQRTRNEERLRLMRSALPETNAGVDPASRRYIRGVLHSNPLQVWWGALITLACHVLIPTGIFAAFALLLKDNGSSLFRWVPSWFLALPLSVFVMGLLYLTISFQSSCRICGQKCFVPRNCLKNSKAHHIPLLGYVFSVALHIILFRWFRCSFCGTPVRLKK